MVTISDLLQDSENVNGSCPEGAQALDASLDAHGFVRPICVDKDGVIVAGNQTQLAALRAGLSKVIEVESDGDAVIVHRRRDLDLDSEDPDVRRKSRGASLADNRVGEVSRKINMFRASQQIASLGIAPASCGYTAAALSAVAPVQPPAAPPTEDPGEDEPADTAPSVGRVHQVVLTCANEQEQRSVYEMLKGLDLTPELRTL